jgi:hypothetical protein
VTISGALLSARYPIAAPMSTGMAKLKERVSRVRRLTPAREQGLDARRCFSAPPAQCFEK